MLVLRALAVAALMIAGAASAQDAVPPQNGATILVIDPERVYLESQRGRAIRAALDAEAAAVQAENDRIVQELVAEEQDLAARRPDMDPADFRAEAEAFDQKAQDIRRARDAKEVELNQRVTEARSGFFDELRPIVGQILLARGGTAVLDSRSVYLVLRSADITDAAIAAMDAAATDEGDTPAEE